MMMLLISMGKSTHIHILLLNSSKENEQRKWSANS